MEDSSSADEFPCPIQTGALGAETPAERAKRARDLRIAVAQAEFDLTLTQTPATSNEDEVEYQSSGPFVDVFPANFTKGLPHNKYGEVVACPESGASTSASSIKASAYCDLLAALDSEDFRDFERICLGCTDPRRPQRRLENPQAGLALSLQGPDSHALRMKPAPRLDSNENGAEMAELYWMALARDVPFRDYAHNPLIKLSAVDLSSKWPGYFNPAASHDFQPAIDKGAWKGKLIPALLFRGNTPGDSIGPYMSQFLLRDVPYGAQVISARFQTLLPNDFMIGYENWLDVQNGCDFPQTNCDPVLRLPRNGRDLSQYVHADTVWQAFLNAAILALNPRNPTPRCEPVGGLGVPFADDLPYANPCAPTPEEAGVDKSRNQVGFATFGKRHLESLLLQAAQLAVQAVWYQKWSVHRRLRPEAYGGWVHLGLTGDRPEYLELLHRDLKPVTDRSDPDKLTILDRIFLNNTCANQNLRANRAGPSDLPPSAVPPSQGTYLLPMAFAEGSPMHPAYGSGHSTVAGACGTILKAFFREDWVIPNPVEPDEAGLSVLAYRGADACEITFGGEVDKLVSNIGVSRIFAGVHWRSDHTQSITLGEEVAIRLLRNQLCSFNENYSFSFRNFRGRQVTITKTDCSSMPLGELNG